MTHHYYVSYHPPIDGFGEITTITDPQEGVMYTYEGEEGRRLVEQELEITIDVTTGRCS
jgi:hypothetical protein